MSERGGEGQAELTREATIMAQISPHENLVSLIGVVTRGLPLMLLISYCEYGSLLEVLRDCADGHGILLKKPKHPHVIALEVTAGMAHLADSYFIHRDLAARFVIWRRTCLSFPICI